MPSQHNKKTGPHRCGSGFLAAGKPKALAQKKDDTGAADTRTKIGNVEASSGPASAYGIIGKIEEAYFKVINEAGGANGRKIDFISYDDGYSPPKTVEQIRKPIESDEVLLVFNALGTDTLIGGIKINTGPADSAPIEPLKMMQFKGGKWEFFGDIISAETTG